MSGFRRILRHFSPSASRNNPKGPTGLTVVPVNLNEDDSYNLDIVLVHGLNGGSRTTWTLDTTFWPEDLLPLTLPNARIMTFGYNANLWKDCGRGRIRDFAESLWADLDMKRTGPRERSRPLLFVCHSMGGLVLKQAIAIAKNKDSHSSILGVPIAIFFLATPHRGSDSARWAQVGTRLWNAVNEEGTTSSAKELQFFSNTVSDIQNDFIHVSDQFLIYSFAENRACRGLGMIVDIKSAFMHIPAEKHTVSMDANHTDICRFKADTDDNWVRIKEYFSRAASELIKKSLESRETANRIPPGQVWSQISTSTQELPARSGQSPQHFPRLDPNTTAELEVPPKSGLQSSTYPHSPIRKDVTNDIPYYLPRNFARRPDNVLEQIRTHFHDQTTDCRAFGLFGQIGVGKTQIALKFLHDNSKLFPIRFWVYADQEQKINTSYESIASQIGFEGGGRNPKETIAVVRHWLEENSNWLLVFDNVENLALIKSYLPRKFHKTSYIIVTSRDHSIGSRGGMFTSWAKVNCFTTEAAAEWFWSQIAHESRDDKEQHLSKEVVKKLDCLPLAMNHIAAYICGRQLSLQEFLSEFDQDESIAVDQELPGANFSYEKNLSTAWNLSLSRLDSEHPEGSTLLDLVSLLDPDRIPLELICHFQVKNKDIPSILSDSNVQRRAISTLVFQSLLEGRGAEPLRVHRMTQAATRSQWTNNSARRKQAFSNALLCLCNNYPRQEKGGSMVALYPSCAKFTTHLQSVLHFYQRHGSDIPVTEDFAEILAHCGWYFFERGETDSALHVLFAAESICSKVGGGHSQTLGLVYNNLGAVYMLRREEKKGLEFTLRAIENRERTISKDNAEIQQLSISYMNYANDMQLIPPFDQSIAAEYYNKALDICQNSPGSTLKGKELLLSNMSFAYYRWGLLQDALHYVQEAVALHPQCGNDTTFMLYTRYYYGNIQWALGARDEGLKIHRDCLRRRQALQGSEHYTTGVSFYKTGTLAFELNILEEARSCLIKAEETFRNYHDDPGLWPRTCLKLSQVLRSILRNTKDMALEPEANELWDKGIMAARIIKGRSFMGENDQELDSLVREVYR